VAAAKLYCGDCESVLRAHSDGVYSLIMTSPPYADARKRTYGGVRPDDYVAWFLPKSEQFLRVLSPTGTFILNIKEKAINGERHPYVLELILALRKQGWLWTEEFVWHKRSCYPGKWPNRFRDAWERCLQFNKQREFAMYQDAVMEPVGEWADARLKSLSEVDKRRDESRVGSGFGKKVDNWCGRSLVYPTNVLHLAAETKNVGHSAAFPESLPAWFIRLFTRSGDVVLDPFAGSGTTLLAARKLGRRAVGIDKEQFYVDVARARLAAEGLGEETDADPR